MTTPDIFNLQRFLDAQKNNYADALREIKPLSLHKTRNKIPQKYAMTW